MAFTLPKWSCKANGNAQEWYQNTWSSYITTKQHRREKGRRKEEKESKTSLTSLKKGSKTSCRKIVVDIKQKLLDRIQSKRFVDYNDARLLIRIFCSVWVTPWHGILWY